MLSLSPPIPKKSIVVIDDSPTVCKVVQVGLHRAGYEVRCFLDPVDAFRAFSSGETLPDLFFIDLVLPHMNGYEVIKHLRSDPACQYIPVVIISRRDGIVDRLKARLLGVRGYVPKPFTTQLLVEIVRQQLLPSKQQSPK